MKQSMRWYLLLMAIIFAGACKDQQESSEQPAHQDAPFLQDFSIKYNRQDSVQLRRVYSDRNGVIQISTSRNLFKPCAGDLLLSGALVNERCYRPGADKNVATGRGSAQASLD